MKLSLSRLSQMKDVYLVGGCRTPFGSFQKSLEPVPATNLGSITIKKTLEQCGINASKVDEVYMGQVFQSGCKQAPARQAALGAGLSVNTPCTTINKVCSSGMKSIMLAAQSIICGHQNVMVAGGQESMSRVPFLMLRNAAVYGGFTMQDGILYDGLTDCYNHFHMGNCAEKTAKDYSISREEQDEYASLSYRRSIKAAKMGIFEKEIVPVTVKTKKNETVVSEDEEYKTVNFEKFSKLRPAFEKETGTITAANASTINDGAASVLISNDVGLSETNNCKPLAKILGFCDASVDPIDFSIAPARAIQQLLQRHSLSKDDIALWEINEAFSVVVLANMKILGLESKNVNIHGGGVSIGHPVAASGARITLHLALSLKPGEKGIAAICNGGGGASAILLERV